MSGLLAISLISLNKPKLIEITLISLVILMSVSFLVTAFLVHPSMEAILKGTFLPTIRDVQLIRVLAILGTTIVPYNLFLHAAIVQKKWQEPSEISSLRIETLVAILLGGSISFSIVISAASTLSGHGVEINSVLEMSKVLEPSIGKWAPWLVSIGLFAAGISSAITAPLAAGYTLKGLLNWEDKAKERVVVILIILSGTILASLGIRPLRLIQLAQVTNAVVLPMIVLALLVVMNKKELLGTHVNKKWQNWLGILIFVLCILAATRLLID